MKDKILSIVKYLAIIVIGISLATAIFYFFDEFINGAFVDWFDSNFVVHYDKHSFVHYNEIKKLVFAVIAIGIVLCSTAMALAAYIAKRKAEKKLINKTSKMIRAYMETEADVFSIFPKNYAPISAEIANIKANIAQKEHILKEEVLRKNDLIAYLAHDLKTPLTSIIGYLTLMSESAEMTAEQRAKYVGITLEKANRLEEMVNSFFDIARYNLQQITISKEQIDLHYMMIQLVEEFFPILKSHGNTVSIDIPSDAKVFADGNELARVFNNILKNAVAYSYGNTPISISAYSEINNIHIVFSNQGKTIPKQMLESIFDKFFRLDTARSTNSGGAGLGLAIAREIVTAHGGSINAHSENETTVFEVILPNKQT